MSELTEKLKNHLAFNFSNAIDTIDAVGMQAENARLRPLHEALVECVATLEYVAENRLHSDHYGCEIKQKVERRISANEALNKLKETLEKN